MALLCLTSRVRGASTVASALEAAKECAKLVARDAGGFAVVVPSTRTRLAVLAVAEKRLEEAPAPCVSGLLDFIVVGRAAMEADAEAADAGELLASHLLLYPIKVYGDEELLEALLKKYVRRVIVEELGRLRRILKGVFKYLVMAPHMPVVSRMSRLAKSYPWLKPSYTITLWGEDSHEMLRKLCAEVGANEGVYREWRGRHLVSVVEEAAREETKRVSAPSMLEALTLHLDTSRLAEALTTKPHPLLRDPWLLLRTTRCRHATKLMEFEDQLYHVAGVVRALKVAVSEGTGIFRASKKVKVCGFTPAVVKHYRSPVAAKWLLAAMASLHLPKPRIAPRTRMLAEYEYNELLSSKGFNVPEPLLIDVRRCKAAYRYVEGVDLIEMLKKASAPPQYKELGELLAQIHRIGVALWDANPSNFVYTEEKGLFIVDLEQARTPASLEDKAWDLAMSAYYTTMYAPRGAGMRAQMIAEGYLEAGGDRKVVEEASKPKYMVPFLVTAPPNVLEKVRRAIHHAAQRG